MYLLQRYISPYTGYTLLLGIFRQIQQAETLRLNYIEQSRLNDPWNKQTYHNVNLEEDTTIIDLSTLLTIDDSLMHNKFLLICHLEGSLGLFSLKVEKVFVSKIKAEKYLDIRDDDDDDWAGELIIYEMLENHLYLPSQGENSLY